MILPTDAAARKRLPIFSGVIAYFPRALAQVANVSREGNEQHHPGAPLHWDKSKSTDQLDALVRHLVDALDPACDPIHALAQVAWRALAELEMRSEDMESSRFPPSPNYAPDDVYRCYPPVTDVYRDAQRDKRAGNDTFSTCLPGEPVTGIAQVMAERDGAGDYGNPVTPHCATPGRLP